jgi:hypothetical protein
MCGELAGSKAMDQEPNQMREFGVSRLVAVFLLVASGSAPVIAAEKPLTIPVALEGKTYATARTQILAAGWKPDYRTADMAWEKTLQKRYPELRYCAVDRPLCSLYFTGKNGSCLRVVTRGETLEEYRVETVVRYCDNITQ